MDAPVLGMARGNVVVVVIPGGNVVIVTVGVVDAFVEAVTITLKKLPGEIMKEF
jgi:hypothetical protein